MNCTCKTDLEAKLLTRFKESSPEAQDHSAKINGYGFVMIGDSMKVQGFLEVEQRAAFPVKSTGAVRQKKVQMNMFFSYCPFCGVKA